MKHKDCGYRCGKMGNICTHPDNPSLRCKDCFADKPKPRKKPAQAKRVLIVMEGGIIQNVLIPKGTKLEVRFYDKEDWNEGERSFKNAQGDRYQRTIYTHIPELDKED